MNFFRKIFSGGSSDASTKENDKNIQLKKTLPEDKKDSSASVEVKIAKEKKEPSWWSSLSNKLSGKRIDSDTMRELEEMLLKTDMGQECTQYLLTKVRQSSECDAISIIREEIIKILTPMQKQVIFARVDDRPQVIMVVGVNGVGKTTTLGKLASYIKRQEKKVVIAAADTFRAAAVEQLKVWGERNTVPVISQKDGADPAAVAFDAMSASDARGADVLLVDTSGRLHNKENLMKELERVSRVMKKQNDQSPHEIWLVLDGTSGQNSFNQIKAFNNSLNITGLVFTKMDARQKVGILVGVAKMLESSPIPICFLGKGESIDALEPFVVKEFVSRW